MRRSILSAMYVLAVLSALASPAMSDDKLDKKEPPSSNSDKKTDLEQLQGGWRLDLKVQKNDYVLRLRFRDKGSGQVEFLRPDPKGNLKEGTGEKAETFGGAVFAGMSYKLIDRDGKRFLAIKCAQLFPEKTTELPYEIKDGVLSIKADKVKFKIDDQEITLDLTGKWKRLK